MTRLIELTKDITNPEHDKRHHHGVKSIPVFKKGTRYLHDKTEYNGDYLLDINTDRSLRIMWDTTKLLLESSTEVLPNDAVEAMHAAGMSSGWYTKRMVQLLWETNRDLFNALVLRMIEEDNNE